MESSATSAYITVFTRAATSANTEPNQEAITLCQSSSNYQCNKPSTQVPIPQRCAHHCESSSGQDVWTDHQWRHHTHLCSWSSHRP